jgi:hypothetical protein
MEYATLAIAIFSMAISILAAIAAFWSAWTTQQALDHASGDTFATLTVVEGTPPPKLIPRRLVAETFAGSATLLRGVEDLLEYNPGITFRNDGSRSIDEIRIDTKMEEGKIEGSDAPKGSPPAKSWVLKQFDRRDFPLARKMLPGEAVNVQVLAGLLAQMIDSQDPARADKLHVARFNFYCYARLVGTEAFDNADRLAKASLFIAWWPRDFPKVKCQEVLREFATTPDFVERTP